MLLFFASFGPSDIAVAFVPCQADSGLAADNLFPPFLRRRATETRDLVGTLEENRTLILGRNAQKLDCRSLSLSLTPTDRFSKTGQHGWRYWLHVGMGSFYFPNTTGFVM